MARPGVAPESGANAGTQISGLVMRHDSVPIDTRKKSRHRLMNVITAHDLFAHPRDGGLKIAIQP